MCVSFFPFCKPLSWPFAALQQLVLPVVLAQAAPSRPVFQEKGAVGLLQPWYTRGCCPAVLPGEGDGFCCATLPGAVVVGGQAAGAGLSRELSGLVQGPRVLWCFGQGRGGCVNKSCASPWLSMGPLPWRKHLHGLALTGTLSAQLPGVPDMMDRGLQSWPRVAFWGV